MELPGCVLKWLQHLTVPPATLNYAFGTKWNSILRRGAKGGKPAHICMCTNKREFIVHTVGEGGVSSILASLGHTGRRVFLGHTLNTQTLMKTDEQKQRGLSKLTILCWAAFTSFLGCGLDTPGRHVLWGSEYGQPFFKGWVILGVWTHFWLG